MSILRVSGSTSSLYQYLQSLDSAQNTGTVAPQTVGATDSDGDSDGSGTTTSTGATTNSPGTSGTGAPSLIQQLESAIQSALNGVNSSQSNDPQTVLASIEQAVQTTLQNNGINPNQLSQTGHHHHHGHHGGGQGGAGGGLLTALATNGGDGSSGSGSSSTSTNSSDSSQTPGLNSLLTQLNIDPQQFRNDIISALSGALNGNLDPSKVFQSFPPGQNVNVLT
jgi:hypothetical protein